VPQPPSNGEGETSSSGSVVSPSRFVGTAGDVRGEVSEVEMTQRKDFKKVVRDRMADTGETYTAARAALEPSEGSAPTRLSLRALLTASFAEAGRLESGYCGPEPALVAVVRSREELPVKRALTAAGMTVELAEAGIERAEASDSGAANPAWQKVSGRAEGIAFGQGIEATAEHFVMAMLWDDRTWTRFDAQVPRDAVIAELRHQGVELPHTSPPALDLWSPTQQVDVPAENLDAVLAKLSRLRTTTGVRFGFNYRADGSAFVVADDKVDLAEVVHTNS
jgi:hypothetical protein